MLKQPLPTGCRRNVLHVLSYVIVFLWCFGLSAVRGQSSKPLPAGAVLALHLDEDGKLRPTPSGFSLIEGESYTFDLTIDPQKKQYKKLWKYVADLCENSRKRLVKNDSVFLTVYGSAKLALLEQDLATLRSVLLSPDPYSAFIPGTVTFSSFIDKGVLQKLLFDSAFVVKIGDDYYNAGYGQPLKLKLAKTADPNETNVVITVADMKKQFVKGYYQYALRGIQSKLTAIDLKSFYGQQVPGAERTRDSLIDLLSKLKDIKSPLICDDILLGKYRSLLQRRSQFLDLINADWMLQWAWFTGGELRLNPLPFGDDESLQAAGMPLSNDANEYNAYIKSVIDLMKSSGRLNETKANYRLMDSLQQELKAGKYSKDGVLQAGIAVNAAAREKAQQIFFTINRTTTRNVSEANVDQLRIRSYDAANHLKGSDENEAFSLPTTTTVAVTVYNLASTQDITLKENAESIADRSDALGDLNDALDVTGTALKGTGGLSAAFIAAVAKVRPVSPNPGIAIVARDRMPVMATQNPFSGGLGIIAHHVDIIFDYKVLLTNVSGKAMLQLLVNNRLKLEVDLNDVATEHLRNRLLADCRFLVTEVLDSIKWRVDHTGPITGHGTYAAAVVAFNTVKDKWAGDIEDITTSFVTRHADRNVDTLIARCIDSIGNWDKAVLIARYPAYLLPSLTAFDDESADTTPHFRNAFLPIADVTTATKKAFELTLTDTKEKKTLLTIKDSYKTSPPHRFTASIGVVYLFNDFNRNTATVTNGVITTSTDEDKVRLFAGLHWHLHKIMLADDRSIFKTKGDVLLSRFSVFAGVSFPDPLYNPHVGVAADIWTGIKLNVGYHWYRYTAYQVLNDQIVNQKSNYRPNGMYVGLSIEPVTFAKLIGLLNF